VSGLGAYGTCTSLPVPPSPRQADPHPGHTQPHSINPHNNPACTHTHSFSLSLSLSHTHTHTHTHPHPHTHTRTCEPPNRLDADTWEDPSPAGSSGALSDRSAAQVGAVSVGVVGGCVFSVRFTERWGHERVGSGLIRLGNLARNEAASRRQQPKPLLKKISRVLSGSFENSCRRSWLTFNTSVLAVSTWVGRWAVAVVIGRGLDVGVELWATENDNSLSIIAVDGASSALSKAHFCCSCFVSCFPFSDQASRFRSQPYQIQIQIQITPL